MIARIVSAPFASHEPLNCIRPGVHVLDPGEEPDHSSAPVCGSHERRDVESLPKPNFIALFVRDQVPSDELVTSAFGLVFSDEVTPTVTVTLTLREGSVPSNMPLPVPVPVPVPCMLTAIVSVSVSVTVHHNRLPLTVFHHSRGIWRCGRLSGTSGIRDGERQFEDGIGLPARRTPGPSCAIGE